MSTALLVAEDGEVPGRTREGSFCNCDTQRVLVRSLRGKTEQIDIIHHRKGGRVEALA
jgi:hypothetical protein